jgi:hypothetical protein
MKKAIIPYEMNGRPLKLIHGFGYGRNDGPEKRQETVDRTLERLYRLGYGGIVTNVDFDRYLESPENWETLRYTLKKAKSMGFRLWLYDEHGYPSGGAGGITLRDHPEYEAKALVQVTCEGLPGESVRIELPRGHEKFVRPEAAPGEPVAVNAGEDGVARAYAIKRLYEGTHAEHNVHESRRYINVLDPDAVRAFIENTYEAYRRELGNLFDDIEAIFTDEPSIMAAYLNAGLYPGRVRDEFDDTLPLLPLVVWDDRLPGRFEAKWGNELLPLLDDLFGPPTDENRDTRFKFYSTTSEMYEEAFFTQLGGWCDANGTNFSGHVLLEEEILHHPLFEGNIFRFVSHMGVPGIDMLTTIPEGVLRQAPTPKLVSSSAIWHGRDEVMSEVSGHMQGGKYGLAEMKGAVALQRALGVTAFPSYYSDTLVSEQEFKDFCDFTANICRLLEPEVSAAVSHMANRVLLLYPVEAAFASSFGSDSQLWAREHAEDEKRLERSWQELNRALLLSGVGYECVDVRTLLERTHIESRGVYHADNCYRAVVLPYMNYLTPETIKLKEKLEAAGVITVTDPGGKGSAADTVNELISELARKEGIYPFGELEAAPAGENPLVISSYFDTRYFRLAFLIVNYTDSPVKGNIKLDVPDWWTGVNENSRVHAVDPDNGIFTKAGGCFSRTGSGKDSRLTYEFPADIRPMGAVVVGFR